MKHRIIDKRALIERPYFELEVELFPDTEDERRAIYNCERFTASAEEKQRVDNYLLFGINPAYSIVDFISQTGQTFVLKVAKV